MKIRPEKRQIGTLCARGHESEPGSGVSWRYIKKSGVSGGCCACAYEQQVQHPPSKETRAAHKKKYYESEKGKVQYQHERDFMATPEGKARQREYSLRYHATEKGTAARKAATDRYNQTEGYRNYLQRYRFTNKERLYKYEQQYRALHRERCNARRRAYVKCKRLEGGEFLVRGLVRRQFHIRMQALATHGKCKPSAEYGIDYIAIYAHLGDRPSPDHWVDHIIPVAYFNHDDPEQICICWHPANLQWLLRMDNILKGTSLPATWPKGLPFIEGTGVIAEQHSEEVALFRKNAQVCTSGKVAIPTPEQESSS